MPCTVLIDVGDSLLHRGHCFHGNDQIQIFCGIILLRGRLAANHLLYPLISPDLNAALLQFPGKPRQKGILYLLVDHKRFTGVAHSDPLGFGIDYNGNGFIKIGILVHKNMTVSRTGLDHRYGAVLHHAPDQPRAAPWNQKIHILFHPHKLPGDLSVRGLDELQGISGNS